MTININILEKLDNEELWILYAETEQELKHRGLVRTRNIVGERGEFLAIDTYNKTKNLPKLQAAPQGTRNIDAISRDGERYSIKTITEPSIGTGVFHGLGDNDGSIPEKSFEYLIIVQLYKNYKPKRILELDWNAFVKHKKWHSTMRAWTISLTKSVLSDSKIIL